MYRPSVRIYILNNAANQTNKLDHMHAALWWLHKFDIVIRSLFLFKQKRSNFISSNDISVSNIMVSYTQKAIKLLLM